MTSSDNAPNDPPPAAATPAPDRKRSRLYLILLFALFALPLALAWVLQQGGWRPSGSVHHGDLLDPALPVAGLRAAGPDGEPLTEAYLRGRWTLAYLAPADCAADCRENLYKIRQLRLALGKDIDRLQTLALLPASPDAGFADWLRQDHAAMTVAVAGDDARALLRRPFEGFVAGEDAPQQLSHSVYLIDPLGNLVMRYRPSATPKEIIADLKRLLKYSRIG